MTTPEIPNLNSQAQRERAESLLVSAHRNGLTDPKELANFMGQVQHESQSFSRLEENLNYSGSRLYEVFGKRNGLTAEKAEEITSIPDRTERHQAVAEQVYGGKDGEIRLGNSEVGDGYNFRGRGYMQLTGRNNYTAYGKTTGLDLVNHPELAALQPNAETLAIQFWKTAVRGNPNSNASTDVTEAGSIINTGATGKIPHGLADRQANATAWEAAIRKEGYLNGVLERHPIDPTNQPLQLKAERQLSPQSLQLIQDSEQQVRQIAQRHQLPWDAGLDNTVAAVASQARQGGLTGITHFKLMNGQIRYAQFDGLTLKDGSLDAHAAANTDAQASLAQMAKADGSQLSMSQTLHATPVLEPQQAAPAPAL